MTANEVTPSAIRMSAMNLLAMREHSEKELAIKLNKKFGKSDWVINELEKLKNDGLQSDKRFTQAYINMRLRQGKGTLIIRLELKEKGVNDVLVNECIGEHVDWDKLALQVYKKKFGNTLVSDTKEKARRIRFLTGRGFSMANIQYVFKHPLNDID